MTTTGRSRRAGLALALVAGLVSGVVEARAQDGSLDAIAWPEGRWVGSGGGFDAFYESFSLDGAVLRQPVHEDSTFTTAQSLSEWRWSDGRIVKYSDGSAASEIAAIVGDSIRIERLDSDGPGYSWVRRGPDEWVAVLERRGGPPVEYVMRRAGPS